MRGRVKGQTEYPAAYRELEDQVYEVLETYSNVHRGSGPFSTITTLHYEEARKEVLEYLGLKPKRYVVIFCSPRSAEKLHKKLKQGSYHLLDGEKFGFSLGIRALAVHKRSLPKGPPIYPGGGTAKLISREWVIWAQAPGKFEAGTPAIINVIMLARALQLMQKNGNKLFSELKRTSQNVDDILVNDELGDLRGKELLEKLKQTYIGRDKQVATAKGNSRGINLDNSASTPTFEPIWNAFRKGLHIQEDIKNELVGKVSTICADFLNAPSEQYEFLFCANTTEAINLAAENLTIKIEDANPVILSTLLEHSSNDLPWRGIKGSEVIRVSVDKQGFVDLKELEGLLNEYNEQKVHGNKRIHLLSISGASNVLGVCNELKEISRMVHRYGAKLLVDAAQLVAHSKIDVTGSEIDYLAFSGHKIYAPFGSGILLVRKELLHFGSDELEKIKSSGEENIGGIAALGKSLDLLGKIGMDVIEEEERALTTKLLKGMAGIRGISIYGIQDPASVVSGRKIGVVAFNLKDVLSFKVGKELASRKGIGIRVGCHCSHIIVKHILNVGPGLERFQRFMQNLFPGISFPGVARVSLGIENKEEDVDLFIDTLGRIARKEKT